jgi:hypothetical protein
MQHNHVQAKSDVCWKYWDSISDGFRDMKGENLQKIIILGLIIKIFDDFHHFSPFISRKLLDAWCCSADIFSTHQNFIGDDCDAFLDG